MRIAIDGHNLEGQRTGVGRFVFNLLKYWAQDRNNQFYVYFKKEIPKDLPQVDNFRYKILGQDSNFLFNQWNLPQAAKKDGADVIFCPAYQAPIFFSGKYVLVIHDIIYEAHPEWYNWNSFLEKLIFSYVFKKSAQKATKIIAPSRATKDEVIKFYGISENRIVVCYEAVDTAFLRAKTEDRQIELIKRKYGIVKKYILTVGSLFTRRHPGDLLRAFELFWRRHRDYQLVIVGEDYTAPPQHLDKAARNLNAKFGDKLVARIPFADDQDLVALYGAADIFVYLSDYEGFGLPPLEAMSRGVPVVTSNKSSLKETSGSAAYLIEDNASLQEIKTAFERIIQDENLRNKLIKNGRDQALKFSWEKCAGEVLNNILKI